MATQTDIDNLVNEIVNQYTNQNIAYYGSYQGQCTVPVAYYVEKITGISPVPGMYADRADGWGVSFPGQLAPYFNHEAYQAGKAYPRGTILMWNSPHIAIVLHSDGSNNVQVFEQNADPDGSACGTKNRVVDNSFHTCTYALVPVIQVEAPAPVPIPVVTAPPAAPVTFPGQGNPYTVVTPLQGYQSATAAGNHSGTATAVEEGTYFIYRYYPTNDKLINISTDKTKPGWWINAADNVLPPTPEPAPSGYVGPRESSTPLPPEPVPKPAVPASVPILKPSEVLVADASDTQWKETYTSFFADRRAVEYKLLVSYEMKEYSGKRRAVNLNASTKLNMVGTFYKNGVKFYRPRANNDEYFVWFYGIPMTDDDGNAILIKAPDTFSTSRTLSDFLKLWKSDVKDIWDIYIKRTKK